MKKFFYLAAMLLSICVSAQVQTINSQLRLTNVQPGSASDSILVRGSNGIVKFRPASDLIGGQSGNGNLQLVLDAGSTALLTSDNYQAYIEFSPVGSAIATQDNSFQYPNGSVKLSGVQSLADYSTIYHNGESGTSYIGALASGCSLKSDNNNGGSSELLIEIPLTQEVRKYVIPAVGSVGTKNIATEEYVDAAVANSGGGSGSEDLNSVLQNGNMSMFAISLVDDIQSPTQVNSLNKDNLTINSTLPYGDNSQVTVRLGIPGGGETPTLELTKITNSDVTGIIAQAGNGTATLTATTPDNVTILDFGIPGALNNPGGDTIYYFPDLGTSAGGQVLATQAYVDAAIGSGGGGSDLQAVTDIGARTTRTIEVAGLGLYDSASDDYITTNVSDNTLSFVASTGTTALTFDLVAGGFNFLSTDGEYYSIGLPGTPVTGGVQLTFPANNGTIATVEQTRSLINGIALNQSGTVVSNQDINVYVFTGAGTFAPTNTMPAGKIYKVRNNHTALITIDPTGSTQINNSLTATVSPGKTLEIAWTGTNYITIGDY